MNALAYLLQRAGTAMRFRDLIGIAAYSRTPLVAFNAATKLGWYNDKTTSCQFLAMILRDYGPRVFRYEVRRRCGDLCLCKCHLRMGSLDDFLEGHGLRFCDDCGTNCGKCYGNDECFSAAHTFKYKCELCSQENIKCMSGHRREWVCFNADGGPSYCSADPCKNCTTSKADCKGCGCSTCNCKSCKRRMTCYNEARSFFRHQLGDAHYSYRKTEFESTYDTGPSELQVPESTPPKHHIEKVGKMANDPDPGKSKVEEVADKIKKVSGQDFKIEVVDRIDNETMQAQAVGEERKVQVTKEMVQALNKDELAWVIAHETGHIEEKDSERREKSAEEIADKFEKGFNQVREELKEKNAGFFKSVAVGLTYAVVAGAAGYVKIKDESRKREKEADDRATELTKKAGYDPASGESALRKMHHGQLTDHTLVQSFTSTHPSPADRAEAIRKKVYKDKE